MSRRLTSLLVTTITVVTLAPGTSWGHVPGWGQYREEWLADHPFPRVYEAVARSEGAAYTRAWDRHLHRAWVDYAAARDAAQASETAQDTSTGQSGPQGPHGPPSPYSGSVPDLIVAMFSAKGLATSIALCVADHESHFNPNAQNPNSGAAGVFQFMPSVWPGFSSSAGYGGYSAFNAVANVGTAAYVVAGIGWGPWKDYAYYDCGW